MITEFKSSDTVSTKLERGHTIGTVNMILPHGNTSIDNDNINFSNFLTSLLNNFVDDLTFLPWTSVDVDWNSVFLGDGLDSVCSVFGSVCDDDGRSGYSSVRSPNETRCDKDIPSAKAVVIANPIPRPPPSY